MEVNARQMMSDAKFYESYSRWLEDEGRNETWAESVERVMKMHRGFYADRMTPELDGLIEFASKHYKDKNILGSQRALQFGGQQLLTHHARSYNCFHKETTFVTSEGVKKFSDYGDGDIIKVLTHQGNWKNAVVRSYGVQPLIQLTLGKQKCEYTVLVTPNHRWILKGGGETTDIKVGDNLIEPANSFDSFSWETASANERLYWCYGMVYGDGTIVKKGLKPTSSMIRLCGHDKNFADRFEEMGFPTTSSNSLHGDFMAFTGNYLKTPPDGKVDSPELIKAFVAGYLQADGEKSHGSKSKYRSIQSSNVNHSAFIRAYFPVAGAFTLSEEDLTGQVTNFGIRPETTKFRINTNISNHKGAGWFVRGKTGVIMEDEVWCLEVEDDHSFVMPNGIVTGNCSVSYADRPAFFSEAMYMLMCGCGVGFSVQQKNVSKLPTVAQPNQDDIAVFRPEDSIEGWADCFAVLLSSYFTHSQGFPQYAGKRVVFDLDGIRPKGALISGGFKAPGPGPLRRALDKVTALMNQVCMEGDVMRPIHVYDFVMHMSDAVLAGGVRRSATICTFDFTDAEMMSAKTGNWYENNPQRGRSNNSAIVLRDAISKEKFTELMKSVESFGEPGFIFTDNEDLLVNPCVTAEASIFTDKGPRLVKDLISTPFNAIVNGQVYASGERGFWFTGEKEVFSLKTKEGFELKLTDNHQLLCNDGKWREVKDLAIGDKVVIHNHKEVAWGEKSNNERNLGWVIGSLVGDGTFDGKSAILRYWGEEVATLVPFANEVITHNFSRGHKFSNSIDKDIVSIGSVGLAEYAATFNIYPNDKAPNHALEEQSSDFYSGYLSGLFDADGSVQGCEGKGVSIRLTQNNLDTLKQAQRMLLRLGIYSRIYQNRREEGFYDLPNNKGGTKSYFCKAVHELIIANEGLAIFADKVGFKSPKKQLALETRLASYVRGLNRVKFEGTVESITACGTEKVYDAMVNEVHCFDANGLVAHNCVEIGFLPRTADGKSGFQVCNLTEISGAKCTSLEAFLDYCKASAILGTLQAGYTDFKYLTKESKEITDREALLGCSITGWMNNPELLFDEAVMRQGAETIKAWNKHVADIIGIRQAARTTCVKPSGNASVILGTASGIHGEHSPRYLRHVQMNTGTDIAKAMQEVNPAMCEKSVWSANGTDIVVAFPIESPEGSIYKSDLYGVKQLEYVKRAQQAWVEFGTNVEICVEPWLRHNVSNTISVDNWAGVTDYVYENRQWFAGISFLGMSGDKDYAQAPFTEVLTDSQIVERYGPAALFASGLLVEGVDAFNGDLWAACSHVLMDKETVYGILGEPAHENMHKYDFIRRARKFSRNYFGGDTVKMTYCLKDVYNLHKWETIQRSIKPVDFVEAVKARKMIDVDTLGSQGCSGGACELSF